MTENRKFGLQKPKVRPSLAERAAKMRAMANEDEIARIGKMMDGADPDRAKKPHPRITKSK